jgi:hypothetical protein
LVGINHYGNGFIDERCFQGQILESPIWTYFADGIYWIVLYVSAGELSLLLDFDDWWKGKQKATKLKCLQHFFDTKAKRHEVFFIKQIC